jgi:hypothetical protein
LGTETGGLWFKISLSQELANPYLRKTSWAWWYTPAILTMWEAEVRGSQRLALGKSIRPLLKNKLKQKELGAWIT